MKTQTGFYGHLRIMEPVKLLNKILAFEKLEMPLMEGVLRIYKKKLVSEKKVYKSEKWKKILQK